MIYEDFSTGEKSSFKLICRINKLTSDSYWSTGIPYSSSREGCGTTSISADGLDAALKTLLLDFWLTADEVRRPLPLPLWLEPVLLDRLLRLALFAGPVRIPNKIICHLHTCTCAHVYRIPLAIFTTNLSANCNIQNNIRVFQAHYYFISIFYRYYLWKLNDESYSSKYWYTLIIKWIIVQMTVIVSTENKPHTECKKLHLCPKLYVCLS